MTTAVIAVKESPILFSAPMVRAILEGHKTQTRRVVNWQHRPESAGMNLSARSMWVGFYSSDASSGYVLRARDGGARWHDRTFPIHCPYGGPGDRLWVRETWCQPDHGALRNETLRSKAASIEYAASMGVERFYVGCNFTPQLTDFTWRPSIHMPRWASRLTLEIVAVRVERLQTISYSDCKAEGVETLDEYEDAVDRASAIGCGTGDIGRQIYEQLWDSINGKKHPWASNPWVWAVEFRRVA